MHQAAKLQFGLAVREFARWRAVAQDERSAAPGWWWGPALQVIGVTHSMPPDWCARLELQLGASFDDGARVLLENLADQKSLTWPGNFPVVARHSEGGQREI
jgi:hypothetical protein